MAGRQKKPPLSYQERQYRRIQNSGLVSSVVKVAETDLHILAPVQVEEQALAAVAEVRADIEGYIREHPDFLRSLVPLPPDIQAPKAVREMLTAGLQAGVGPMAAVAGTVAELVGQALSRQGINEVIVENGGDIFISRTEPSTVSVYAGESPLSGRVGVHLRADQMPCGVCCSSGTIGHSLSLGRADAVVVVAASTPLADAAATRLGNAVGGQRKRMNKNINAALELAGTIDGLSGVLIISGKHLGARGDLELVRL
ncbi:MAG: UPF0280 family protein [Candidatus Electrothrix sp. YB6]